MTEKLDGTGGAILRLIDPRLPMTLLIAASGMYRNGSVLQVPVT